MGGSISGTKPGTVCETISDIERLHTVPGFISLDDHFISFVPEIVP